MAEDDMLFDEPYYLEINHARWEAAAAILDRLDELRLRTCLDLGCGPGWFSERLAARGLAVTGIEGRENLVQVARERCRSAKFERLDVESEALSRRPAADLVFCFGLLYHLENPFAFARRLGVLTGRVLLLETILAPGDEPLARLVEEGRNDTQGLTHCSLIPTRTALVKMLSLGGFAGLFEWTGPINHPDFQEGPGRIRRRAVLVGLKERAGLAGPFSPVEIPAAPKLSFQRDR